MSPPWFRRIIDTSTLISIIRNLIWLVPTVVSAFLYLYASPSYRVFLTVAAPTAIAVSAITFAVCSKVFTKDNYFGYRIISASYTYVFQNDISQHHHDVVTEIVAQRNGVCMYESRYTWSGNGPSGIKLLGSPAGQVLLKEPEMRYSGRTYYYVRLIPPLQKNEKRTISVRQDLVDSTRKMDHQLTKRVDQPMEALTLCVEFPENGPGESDVWAIARKSIRDDSLGAKRLDVRYDSSTRRATFKVDNPRRGMTYAIEWHWDAYRQVAPSSQTDSRSDTDKK